MNEIEQYVREVLHNIHAPAPERDKIESDLRAHLEEATATGQPPRAVIDHMGSPTEVAAEFMSQIKLNYAGFWPRLAAFVVDLFIIIAGMGILTGVVALLASWVPAGTSLFPPSTAGLTFVLGACLVLLILSCILAMFALVILYFPVQEARFGQTMGKRWMGLYVLKEGGLPIGHKEAFLRRLSFYFDILPLDALFIPFTGKKQRAFDIVARTIVVKERAETRKTVLTLAVPLLVFLALAGGMLWVNRDLREGYVGQHVPGHLSASYQLFRGYESDGVNAQAGQTLTVNYQATATSGNLVVKAIDPHNHELWQVLVSAPAQGRQGSREIPIEETGHYTVVVQGNETAGSYDVTWRMQ